MIELYWPSSPPCLSVVTEACAETGLSRANAESLSKWESSYSLRMHDVPSSLNVRSFVGVIVGITEGEI
jgi:hypothetical protein